MVLIYSDDMLLAKNDQMLLYQVKKQLMQQLKVQDLGRIKNFLGVKTSQELDKKCSHSRIIRRKYWSITKCWSAKLTPRQWSQDSTEKSRKTSTD